MLFYSSFLLIVEPGTPLDPATDYPTQNCSSSANNCTNKAG